MIKSNITSASEFSLDFKKYADGLIPVIIQDSNTGTVLMLGFMNQEAVNESIHSGRVCFFSRSKQRLWKKGEESGNYLELVEMLPDCDNDSLLVRAIPHGPVCHTGQDTCFGETNTLAFLHQLEIVIESRKNFESNDSYVSKLLQKGINSIAQKVGEEAVELIIEAKDNNDEKFLAEAADLLFHYLILLNAKGKRLDDVETILKERHRS